MFYRFNFYLVSLIVVIHSDPIIIDEGYEISHPSLWNYNYSQVECPIECTINDKCGPNCWYHIKSTLNQCNNKYQSPINIVQVESDPSLEYFSKNDFDGCNNWTQVIIYIS